MINKTIKFNFFRIEIKRVRKFAKSNRQTIKNKMIFLANLEL